MSAHWKTWLSTIPLNEQEDLYTLLSEGREVTKPQEETKVNVRITKTPVEDLLVKNPPAYLDIFHLHDVYKNLAYRSNLLVKGPKGDGKTLSFVTFAYETKTPLIYQECSEDTKKTDLIGASTMMGTETIFTLGAIPSAIETANEYGRAILLFEELSALTPQVQKQMNAITDFRRMCSLPALGKTFRLKDGAYLWVAGTMNPSVYGGTYDLNEDLKSRFEEIDLTYPTAGEEKQILRVACRQLMGQTLAVPYRFVEGQTVYDVTKMDDHLLNLVIKLAGETRQQATGYALSTRDLTRIIETIVLLGVEKALQLVLCKFEGDEDKSTIRKRISSIFSTSLNIQNYWS